MTRGPTSRVARSLKLFREVADEIVVAVDDRVDPALLGPIVEVADLVVRYPYADPVDRPVGWLHSLCSGSWILNVDDDETPSRALLDMLPALARSTDVTHVFVPRLWPFPTPATYLDDAPWRPDWQLRLVVNDPRVTWFPGVLHWPAQAVGPHRYLEAPLYHLDLLANTREQRVAKADWYEQALPGRRQAGLPMNVATFLPELRDPPPTLATPEPDVVAIAGVMDGAPWPEPSPAVPPLRRATREEIDAHFRGESMTDDDYRATITFLGQVRSFAAREQRDLSVGVTNDGGRMWPWGGLGTPDVRLSYRWLDAAGAVAAHGLRTTMPAPVAPGSSIVVAATVLAPESPGRYVLELDLVHEHRRWFGCAARVGVDVRPVPRVAVLASDEPALAAAAAAIVAGLPAVEPLLLATDPTGAQSRLGYPSVESPRSRVLGSDDGRGRGGIAGLLARGIGFLVSACSRRAPTACYDRCSAFLLADDAVLRGSRGRAEAWIHGVAVVGARLAGLPVVAVSTGRRPLAVRLALALARATVVAPAAPGQGGATTVPAVVALERKLAP